MVKSHSSNAFDPQFPAGESELLASDDADLVFVVEITDVFDLHTIAPRDVRRAVAAYLEEAREREFTVVRLIHGKGIGVQREAVRSILAKTDFVVAYADAPANVGGWGATIARLDLRHKTT